MKRTLAALYALWIALFWINAAFAFTVRAEDTRPVETWLFWMPSFALLLWLCIQSVERVFTWAGKR